MIFDSDSNQVLEATEYLYAPQKGVEIMMEVVAEVQRQTNLRGVPIQHHYQATNKAAKILITQKLAHLDYCFCGITYDIGNKPCWHFKKTYFPTEEA
ncbi:MAG: hypothetical protein Q9M76_04365 [Candidatus Dojkabacteria bacterium]|nr:hypothetical protein [Candidatus Dojkabacteria bacterium]